MARMESSADAMMTFFPQESAIYGDRCFLARILAHHQVGCIAYIESYR
jgi:hypothetical protein